MSYFAAGGGVGFFLAPALVTPALAGLVLRATVLFIPPALLMSYILLRHHRRNVVLTAISLHGGIDRPRLFAVLTGVEVIRSTISFGINTFVSLYWISHLGASTTLGGAALTL